MKTNERINAASTQTQLNYVVGSSETERHTAQLYMYTD